MLILASTSRYRAELLNRLGLPFDCQDPQIEEPELAGEKPQDRANRLALEKAESVAKTSPHAVIIGSDQVAAVGGQLLHKPGTMANALRQLQHGIRNRQDGAIKFTRGSCSCLTFCRLLFRRVRAADK